MTISEFAQQNNIKVSLIQKWVSNGLIPGVTKDSQNGEINIPQNARVPYTAARATSEDSIYTSIATACINKKHVVNQLYNISEDKFEDYINNLVASNIIVIRNENNVAYYDATISAQNAFQNGKKEFREYIVTSIADVLGKIAEGITRGLVR